MNKTNRNPRGYWDVYENNREEASKYETKIDFRRKSESAYDAACKNGWLETYDWLKASVKPSGYWDNYDNNRREALDCKTRQEFKRKNSRGYQIASKNGWLDTYDWFESPCVKNGYWTVYENNRKAALECKTRGEFMKKYSGGYQVALKNGWLETYDWFEQKTKPAGYWTKERVREEALKYTVKREFRFKGKGAYNVAERNGWLNEFDWLTSPQKPNGYWNNYDNNRNEALKYKTKYEFQDKCNSAYSAALKNGWLDTYDWFETTQKPKGYWDEENTRSEALKYKSKGEFCTSNGSAYASALKNGWIDTYDWFEKSIFSNGYTLSLLKSGDLEGMSQHQLIELIASKKLPKDFNALTYTTANSERRCGTIRELIAARENNTTEADAEAEIERIENTERENSESHLNQEVTNNGVFSLVVDESTQSLVDTASQSTETNQTPQVSLPSATFSRIRIYDDTLKLKPGDKAAEFIVEEECSKLWNSTLYANEDGMADEEFERIKSIECGEFSSYVRDKFVAEYEAVTAIQEDEDYRFYVDGNYCRPLLMQKLMAYKMSVNKEFGNWCGTGAGKTNAFLFSTRHINAKVTVAIVPNDVIATLDEAIRQIYPNSRIVVPTHPDDIETYDRSQYTYIIFNYEKFQVPSTANGFINSLFDTNTIDFVCLDEAHNIKVRDEKTASNRSKYINTLLMTGRKANPEMRTLFMTATPCPNSLAEPRSIVESLTGKKYPEIGNRTSVMNVHNAYKALLLNGFRYVPKYPIVIKERTVPVDCSNDAKLYDELTRDRNVEISEIEYALAKRKLETIKNELKDGTVVYSNWVNGMAKLLYDNIKSWGFKVECYNGISGNKEGRREILDRFLAGKTNVLVCSQPISTGINGLQKRCNKMILVSLPWTDDNYTQLKGRIYRQGSVFKEVEFVIPQIYITLNDGNVWSWDALRLNAIETKRSLSSATVDGYIQESYRLNRERLKHLALEALKAGLEEVTVEREDIDIDVDLTETEEQRRARRKSFVSEVHRRANTSKSETIRTWFTREVEREYHISRRENVNTWIEDPVERVAGFINKLPKRYDKIIDLGCGENKLKTLTERFVQGVNLNKLDDDTVIEANMAHLDGLVKDEEYNVAVFCLSLWGCGYDVFRQYLNEAYRVLDGEGRMYIVEPSDSFGDEKHYGTKDNFIDFVESVGFKQVGRVHDHYGKLFFEFSKF